MTIKEENHRFVIVIEKESFEKFKILAAKDHRSASNLAVKLINDYIEQNENFVK